MLERDTERQRIQNGCCLTVFAVFDGPLQEAGETALHYSVRTADQTSLHLVDFLVQNRYICYLFMWISLGTQGESKSFETHQDFYRKAAI